MVRAVATKIHCNSLFNYKDRCCKLWNKVETFAKRMGLDPSSIELCITPFGTSAACLRGGPISTIVPFQFLIDPHSIPSDLCMSGPQDERLKDSRFRTKITAWINQLIDESKLGNAFKPREEKEATDFLWMASEPERYTKSVDFCLVHELAHVLYKISKKTQLSYKDYAYIALLISCIVFGVVLLAFAGIILSSYLMGLGLTCLVGAQVIHKNKLHFLHPSSFLRNLPLIEQEQQADIEAAKALYGDISGGEYYFLNSRRRNLLLRALGRLEIDPEGNDLEDKEHPLLTERIANLRAWKAQNS